MIMTPAPGSPEGLDHLTRLLAELGRRANGRTRGATGGMLLGQEPGLKLLDAYYLGEYQLPWVSKLATSKYGRVFRDLMASVTDNWMALVVDATTERLHVEGFRLNGDDTADDETWEMWQANDLDSESELLHTTAHVCGTAYTMVWRPGAEGSDPVVTIEHPLQTICGYENASAREPGVALKSYTDEWTNTPAATLYYADKVHTYERGEGGWRLRAIDGEVDNPFGVVPVVEYSVRPHQSKRTITSRGGRSELVEVISTQDQIVKLVCDMLVAAEFGAFRQRWVSGLELPPGKTDDDQWFESAVSRVFRSPAADTKWGEFAATDLANYIRAIENRVQSLASRTRTPPHYLLGNSGSFPSGESLRAAETGLIAKVGARARFIEEGHERTVRLMWKLRGDEERAGATSAETIWRDHETRSESEHVDALGKMRTLLDVPPQALWQRAGFSPPEIKEFRTLLAEWSLFSAELDQGGAGVFGPPAPAPADGVPVA